MTPKVTVLMTVYNGERYLKECMDSVLSQSFKDFEFLIVDDCGADSSKDIIKSYKDDRIRLIENKQNVSQVRSLNIGLEHAQGEYIARMDQDDVMMKNRLERQLDFLDKRQDISIVGTWGEAIDENGKVFDTFCYPTKNEEIVGGILYSGNPLMHMSVIFKKDAVISVGKYDESRSFAEDYDLWTRLLLKRYRFANIPEFLVQFRYHRESSSRLFRETQIKSTYIAISNFLRNIVGSSCDINPDSLCNILINSGMMRKEYWLDETDTQHSENLAGLLEMVLRKVSDYFKFGKKEAYLMRKIFCNRMLNFAYAASGRGKRKSLPLYLFCLKNSRYLLTRPKLYLYPIRPIL